MRSRSGPPPRGPCDGNARGGGGWSGSRCVARNPFGGNPACSNTPGNASSSSGKYGESTSRASPPARRATALVCQSLLVMTSASRCAAATRTRRSDGLQQLGRVAEGLDLRGRLLLARLELLAAPVDPDHSRHPGLERRLDVRRIAAADVDPVLLRLLDAARAFLEVGGIRLVATDLLGR